MEYNESIEDIEKIRRNPRTKIQGVLGGWKEAGFVWKEVKGVVCEQESAGKKE